MVQGIWEEFLQIIREESGSRLVDTWFKAVTLYQWDKHKKTVYLQAPNSFVCNWVQTHYSDIIQLHLGRLLHVQKPKIIFINEKENGKQSIAKITVPISVLHDSKKESLSLLPMSLSSSKKLPSKDGDVDSGHVNKTYSFNTFVVGPSNSFAYTAARSVSEKPGRYNPLFIYGESGLGKTHLLHSIGNEIKTKNRRATVLYQTTDRFVNEFISAIRFNKIHTFQGKYKKIDVLLIDDVQFISNKEQTQEAFFHIFNALYDAKKQIVFSSDTFPQNITGLAERLRSRLGCGLVADIQVPSLEMKIAILKKKAEISNVVLEDEIAHFIASRSAPNIRELGGALVRVMAFSSLTKQPVSLELVKKVLIYLYEGKHEAHIDFERIIKIIEQNYPYKVIDLCSKSRNKDLSFVRQLTMFLMKKLTNKSLRDIGEFLGKRDHSTVLYAVDKIERCMAKNEQLSDKIRLIEQELGVL